MLDNRNCSRKRVDCISNNYFRKYNTYKKTKPNKQTKQQKQTKTNINVNGGKFETWRNKIMLPKSRWDYGLSPKENESMEYSVAYLHGLLIAALQCSVKGIPAATHPKARCRHVTCVGLPAQKLSIIEWTTEMVPLLPESQTYTVNYWSFFKKHLIMGIRDSCFSFPLNSWISPSKVFLESRFWEGFG